MKRSFQELDESVPECVWDLFPEKKQQLELIKKLELDINDTWSTFKRKSFALNSKEKTRQKILRIYMRHEFIAASGEERAHFLLSIEGRIVDAKIGTLFPLGMFFSSISIQTEKKLNTDGKVCGWEQDVNSEGSKANCFRFKIYADKNYPVKVYFTRSNYALRRFEPPPLLRQLFPMISIDPTEEEVLMALWRYVHHHGLIEPTSPFIRFDDKLRALFGGSQITSCMLHGVRKMVRELLLPVRAISVDYTLTTTGWSAAGGYTEPEEKRYTSRAMSKAGGRLFDIDVDVVDPFSALQIEGLNAMSVAETNMEATIDQVQQRLGFLVTAMLHCSGEIETLQKLREQPIDPLLIAPPTDLSDPVTATRCLANVTRAPCYITHPLVDRRDSSSCEQDKTHRECLAGAVFLATVMDPVRNIVERRRTAGPSGGCLQNLPTRRRDVGDDDMFSAT